MEPLGWGHPVLVAPPAIRLWDILRSSTTRRIKFLKLFDWLIGRFILFWIRPAAATPTPIEDKDLRSILVIRAGGIGDAVWVIPLMQQLKRTFPEAAIDVLAENRNEELFLETPGLVNRCFRYDQPPWRWWPHLSRVSYDLILDTEQWHHGSGICAYFLKAPIRVGFNTNPLRSRCYTVQVPYSQDDFEGDSFLKMASVLTGVPLPPDGSGQVLSLSEEKLQWAKEQLANRPVAAIALRGGVPERCWEPEKFQALFPKLLERNLDICLLGSKAESALAQSLIQELPHDRVINLTGKSSLLESAAILSLSKLFIGTDSGPMHLAFGVGTPVVALFGAGREKKWGLQRPSNRILNRQLPCSPCTRYAVTPPCPIGIQCLRDITAEEVLRACQEIGA